MRLCLDVAISCWTLTYLERRMGVKGIMAAGVWQRELAGAANRYGVAENTPTSAGREPCAGMAT